MENLAKITGSILNQLSSVGNQIEYLEVQIERRDQLMAEFIQLIESDGGISDEQALRYVVVLDELKGILKL